MFNITHWINFVKKHVTVQLAIIAGILLLLFFVTRLPNLSTNLPIFSDEGIYIEWSKTARRDASQRFISLTDGRQPLQTWATIPFLKLFPDDSLLAARLFAVFGGLFGMAGIFLLLRYIFNIQTAIIGALLYLLTPMFLFYDRIGLIDTLIAAFATWSVYGSVLLKRYLRLDLALILGMLLGIGLLGKSTVQLFLLLGFLAPVLIYMSSTKKEDRFLYTVNYWCLWSVTTLIALSMYSIQRLTPYFHIIGQKNTTFILTLEQFIQEPFKLFFQNSVLIPEYITSETGIVFMIFALFGFGYMYKTKPSLSIYIGLWILIPYLIIANFNQVLFPRYLLFIAELFIIPAAYGIYSLGKKPIILAFILTAYVLIHASQLYAIMYNAPAIKLPAIDGQYVNGTTAGYGMKEVIEYAREETKKKPVIILAEGNFGLAGDVLKALTKPSDTFVVEGFWPLGIETLKKYQDKLSTHTILVVYAQKNEFSSDYPLELIQKYDKPEGKSVMYLFKLTR
jgi:4-amino-4-deoxy-L-arabinose transferase-like glycosyltransferase